MVLIGVCVVCVCMCVCVDADSTSIFSILFCVSSL